MKKTTAQVPKRQPLPSPILPGLSNRVSPITVWAAACLIGAFSLCLPHDLAAEQAGEPTAADTTTAEQSPDDTAVTGSSSAGEPTDSEQLNSASGLWIFIDPETGQRMATPSPKQKARLRKFATALNKSDLGLEPFELEGGGQGVRLNGRFQHAMVATVNDDGTIAFHCSDHGDENHAGHVAGAVTSGTVTPEGITANASTEPAPEQ